MLPMDKSFTLEKSTTDKLAVAGKVRQSTINFIKQFARAYSYERRLSLSLGGLIKLNLLFSKNFDEVHHFRCASFCLSH